MSKFSYTLISLILIIVSSSLFFLQKSIHTSRKNHTFEDMKYLPSGNFLKGASLSYDEVFADLLWIKLISYYGHHAKTDQNYEWLSHLIEITTTLDPLYEDPYEFGANVLALEPGTIAESNVILKKGLTNVPQSHKRYWRLNFYLAFNYMYYEQNYTLAAQHLEQAAKTPGSPEYLPLLVSRLYANANDPRVAITFLQEMLQETESIEFRKKLERRILEIKSDHNIRQLEKARDIFVQKNNRLPHVLQELVTAKIIPAMPDDPLGGEYIISQENGSINSTTMANKLILHLD